MIRYVLKRILLLIPVIIIVSFIVFTLMDLAPGDPIAIMIAGGAELTAEDILMWREHFNLDRTVFYRYGLYMLNLLQGNLGVSDISGIDVWNLYITRLPYTLALAGGGLIIGTGFSIPLGIRAAKKAGKLSDNITTTFSLIGMSMPSFWLGILLMLIFSYHLGWLPAGGARHGLRSYVLPILCSGMMLMALSTRQTRSSMLEVLNSDYLRTARAKGVPESQVINKHALGNAWIPIVTTIGTALSASLAGSAVIEAVFAWPGVGRMTVDAVFARDVTTVTGAVIMTTIIYVLVQLIVDISYAFVDPRIKAQYTSGKRRKKAIQQIADTSENTDTLPQEGETAVLATDTLQADEDRCEQEVLDKIDELTKQRNKDSLVHQTKTANSTVGDMIAATTSALYSERADKKQEDQEASQSGSATLASETKSDKDKSPANPSPYELVEEKRYKKRNQLGEIAHHLSKNKGAMVGIFIIGAMILLFFITLFISFDVMNAPNVMYRFTGPGRRFWFGSDGLGRDQFLRVIYGTRYSLLIGFSSASIGAIFGILLGSLAGYYGKLVDEIIMRFSDSLASIPAILLGMVIVTVLGQSIPNLIIAVGVPAIPIYIRITRAAILSLRGQEYVEAARAIGLSNTRIIFTQLVPNGLAPIIVTFTTSLGISIIIGASLSFLGFGVPVPHPEWGALISTGRDFIRIAPWLTTFPGLFIMVTVLAFNLLGDGLRDALDPKQKK